MKNSIAIVVFCLAAFSCSQVQESNSVATLSYNSSSARAAMPSNTPTENLSVSLMETKVEALSIQTADFEFKPKAETGKSWFNNQKPKIQSDTDELPDTITFD